MDRGMIPAWLRAWLRGLLKLVIVLALVLGGGAAIFGTPHLRWNCTCRDQRWNRDCATCRVLVHCNYLGVQGRQRVYPQYGERCGWFKMLPVNWGNQGVNIGTK